MSELFVGKKNYSIEEYQMLEERSVERLEYYDGKIIPMPGGTIDHSTIVGNVYFSLRQLLKHRTDLRFFSSDQKVYLPKYNFFVYPDAMVIAGPVETRQGDKTALINPLVIVEVLSRSTESYDRNQKFDLYQSLPSLREYILVRQDRAELLSYFREANDTWRISEVAGIEKALSLSSLNIALPLSQVYENVDLNE